MTSAVIATSALKAKSFISNPKRVQSQGEEIANSISHGTGLEGALV
jgi:hypothetical protein